MKASQYLNSQFIQQVDLTTPIQVTIAKMEATKDLNNKDRLKATFSNAKALTLNNTNLKRLIKAFGDDVPTWVGQSITVYWDDEVEFAGRQCGGVRVRVPKIPLEDITEAMPRFDGQPAA